MPESITSVTGGMVGSKSYNVIVLSSYSGSSGRPDYLRDEVTPHLHQLVIDLLLRRLPVSQLESWRISRKRLDTVSVVVH